MPNWCLVELDFMWELGQYMPNWCLVELVFALRAIIT
jgi:hypothetical protein